MLTEYIEEKIINSDNFNEKMIKDNPPPELHILLNKYLSDKKMKKADFIRKLNIDRNYGYWILSGKRLPTRNCLIQMSLILGLDAEQINYLLRLAGKSTLYVRNMFDAKVFYVINHRMDYLDALEFIWDGAV